jgi:16S rRNA (guanine(966)-N(2))-methyltransferase RsmD
MFNIIRFSLQGQNVLDLFCGSGQLGIEALSGGAARAVFVDSCPRAVATVRRNLASLGVTSGFLVEKTDALRYIRVSRESFGVVFADPPYASTLLPQTLRALALFDILAPDGIIVCEHGAGEPLPLAEGWRLSVSKRHGIKRISILTHEGGNAE